MSKPTFTTQVRDKRYCELFLVTCGETSKVDVYSTFNLNRCPEVCVQKVDLDRIARQYKASYVVLNGPRHWVIDELVDKSTGATRSLGCFTARQVAQIPLTSNQCASQTAQPPYGEQTIARSTIFIYNKGTMVYKLINPMGDVYVMQSYSQIVDPTLRLSSLPTLATRLSLPVGWVYQTQILEKNLFVTTDNDVAIVIQDDLKNSYQKHEAKINPSQNQSQTQGCGITVPNLTPSWSSFLFCLWKKQQAMWKKQQERPMCSTVSALFFVLLSCLLAYAFMNFWS